MEGSRKSKRKDSVIGQISSVARSGYFTPLWLFSDPRGGKIFELYLVSGVFSRKNLFSEWRDFLKIYLVSGYFSQVLWRFSAQKFWQHCFLPKSSALE